MLAENHGGGFCGVIGGTGTKPKPHTRGKGAVGHQRYINHIYVVRGIGVWDSSRADVQPRVRVVKVNVVTDSACEDVRVKGESRCACWFSQAVLCNGKMVWGADAREEFDN